MIMTRLYPLFSGSSGNCYYLGSPESGVLIDTGRSAKQIEQALRDNSLDPKRVSAVFITHEHTDHIQGLRVFASRYGVKVYSSPGTMRAMEEKGYINEKVDISPIDLSGMETDDMRITPFHTSHDCAEGGPYPYILKKRILSDKGHLSNETCAGFLAGLIKSGTTRLMLAHLSRENNIPALAEQTAVCELTLSGMQRDRDFMLRVAPEQGGKMLIY